MRAAYDHDGLSVERGPGGSLKGSSSSSKPATGEEEGIGDDICIGTSSGRDLWGVSGGYDDERE
jgi:hypothetical protein